MVRVRVLALSTPQLHRHCPRCQATRPFASSDRFRVNAQKKVLDVWLIYRCAACDFTWNREVLTRVPVGDVPPERLRAFHENDVETARRHAFAEGGAGAGWRVEASGPIDGEVVIDMPQPVEVRLDRLLGAAFGLSRRQVTDRFAGQKALRHPAKDGQVIAGRP